MTAIPWLNFLILYRNYDFELISHLHVLENLLFYVLNLFTTSYQEESWLLTILNIFRIYFSKLLTIQGLFLIPWKFILRENLTMNRAELAQIVEMSILCDSILFDQRQWYQAWMTLTFLGQVTIRLKYLHTVRVLSWKIKLWLVTFGLEYCHKGKGYWEKLREEISFH